MTDQNRRKEWQRQFLQMQRASDEIRTAMKDWMRKREHAWESVFELAGLLESLRDLDGEFYQQAHGMSKLVTDAAYMGIVMMLGETGMDKLEEEEEGSDVESRSLGGMAEQLARRQVQNE